MTKSKTIVGLPSEPRISCILRSKDMRAAIAECAQSETLAPRRGLSFSSEPLVAQLEKTRKPEDDADFFKSRLMTEAIVLTAGRPVLLVRNGEFEKASVSLVEKRIAPVRAAFKKSIGAVGRIELHDHDTLEWCGTGWRIEDDLIVTNRHVALVFAERHGSRTFRLTRNQAGKPVRACIDFREEWQGADSEEFDLVKVLWIAPESSEAPDMAVLQVLKAAGLPPPLQLSKKAPKAHQQIAVVGYPAHDSRNGEDAMSDIFRDIYDVKRFAPGEVVRPGDGAWYLTHDASTLGGNSGSAVFDLASQEVVGLHFGGSFRKTNFAVKASVMQAVLKRRGWVSMAPGAAQPEAFTEKKRTLASMEGRTGYDEKFLGKVVPMPTLGSSHSPLAVPFPKKALPYTHFSIVMSKTRRLAIFTAENLDGSKKKKLKRKDTWGFDPRIPAAAQVGHKEFYRPEPFDKGHMVRRENPGWGDTVTEAQRGEDDSFIYTNAAPQMPGLNQKTWLALEDYILENAKVEGFKVCVFTGPVLRAEDPDRGGVQVPLDFWKVVVAIDTDTAKLLTVAYLLTQEGMLPTEAFRYGAFRTYQVSLKRVEALADIRFSASVRKADVFADSGEELLAQLGVEIYRPEDVILSK
ncbi:MAG: DNA/RNA non-specific endonuclease [Planctomycetota bacterium]|jgi:endonuclease G